MANPEHVDRLLQGVEAWNRWRQKNPEIKPNLSYANLRATDLSDTNLSDADLSDADLSDANLSYADLFSANLSDANLSYADLRSANLSSTNLSSTNLSSTNLRSADLRVANLSYANLFSASLRFANLRSADLVSANLSYADLFSANLSYVNLSDADLVSADLSAADLSAANLSAADFFSANLSAANLFSANLSAVQALKANFQATTLTGACIEDWNINSRTNLQEINCEYVFTGWFYDSEAKKLKFTDRRPHDPNQIFAPGEFTKRYQIVLETVDLFFNDGIDWKAFLASLNNLQTEYGNEVNVQGIEKKAGGTFLVRLEVPPEMDKGTIEQQVKASYEANLKQLEAQYRADLHLRDKEIEGYLRENTNLMRTIELLAKRPIINQAMASADNQSKSESYTNHFNHSTIGNFANKMQDQASMQTNQYIGANLHEITSLIQSLRSSAEAFPQEKRAETLEYLDDLEKDVQQPPEKRKVSRMKATLLALVGIATAVSGAVTSTNEFVGQVQELSEKLGIELPIAPLQSQNAIDSVQP